MSSGVVQARQTSSTGALTVVSTVIFMRSILYFHSPISRATFFVFIQEMIDLTTSSSRPWKECRWVPPQGSPAGTPPHRHQILASIFLHDRLRRVRTSIIIVMTMKNRAGQAVVGKA